MSSLKAVTSDLVDAYEQLKASTPTATDAGKLDRATRRYRDYLDPEKHKHLISVLDGELGANQEQKDEWTEQRKFLKSIGRVLANYELID